MTSTTLKKITSCYPNFGYFFLFKNWFLYQKIDNFLENRYKILQIRENMPKLEKNLYILMFLSEIDKDISETCERSFITENLI